MSKLRDEKGRYYSNGIGVLRKHPKFYGIWANMKERCDNKSYYNYRYYGGRGVKYAPQWSDVDKFYEDMFPHYKPGLTLDRVDNNGDYSPGNCRWADRITQANNKRSNNYVTYDGQTKSIADWARQIGLKHNTLWHRIMVYKWPLKRCMTEGVN